jgi:hypothetical protein
LKTEVADINARRRGLGARGVVLLAALFFSSRAGVVSYYDSICFFYYYGMVSNQYAIAEAAFNGHFNSEDFGLKKTVRTEAFERERPIPIEEWKDYPKTGKYTTFPAQDLPGYGYLIAYTSKLAGGELTTRYAYAVQLAAEFAAMLALAACAGAMLGGRAALCFGLFYIFLFPFIWPLAFQPMRDIFNFAVSSFSVAAFFAYSRGKGTGSLIAAAALLVLSSLLLWVAPRCYYCIFLLAPASFFAANKTLASKTVFAVLCVAVPVSVFGIPYRNFNIAHYGTPDTATIGRGLWEGMGIAGENKYGFKLDDSAMIPFLRERGYENVSYGSPEMNRLLGEYAIDVIKKDPGFYLKTILVRARQMARNPLPMFYQQKTPRNESGLSRSEYIRKNPIDAAMGIAQNAWALAVFHLGLILSAAMVFSRRGRRAEAVVFLLPVFYLLATTLPLHFEARYMAAGAPALIAPLLWGAEAAMGKLKRTKRNSENPLEEMS